MKCLVVLKMLLYKVLEERERITKLFFLFLKCTLTLPQVPCWKILAPSIEWSVNTKERLRLWSWTGLALFWIAASTHQLLCSMKSLKMRESQSQWKRQESPWECTKGCTSVRSQRWSLYEGDGLKSLVAFPMRMMWKECFRTLFLCNLTVFWTTLRW